MMIKVLIAVACFVTIANCGLLRTPKIYNALITTDTNLMPSRAFPLIQPTIHETGYYSPFAGLGNFPWYNPYAHSFHGAYNNYGGDMVHSIQGRQNLFRPDVATLPESQPMEILSEAEPMPLLEKDLPPSADEQLTKSEQPDGNEKAIGNSESPIPLNEFGLPPRLIPIAPFSQPQAPINLQPYPYSSYPLIYESFGRYNPNPYLPPYGYYPSAFHSDSPPASAAANPLMTPLMTANVSLKQKDNRSAAEPSDTIVPATAPKIMPMPAMVNIKNNSNTNKNVPDVPAPPLPSGAN